MQHAELLNLILILIPYFLLSTVLWRLRSQGKGVIVLDGMNLGDI